MSIQSDFFLFLIVALQFKIDGDTQSYVAKKIFDIGKGRGVEVTADVNQSILSRDLIRLKRLAWFYKSFIQLVAEKGLDELAGELQ
jgi:hypothetical protein